MTLYSLIATYNHPEAPNAYEGCYSYNDPKFDLVAEPLVHDCTQAIICAMASADMCLTSTPPSTIKLDFTNNSITVLTLFSGFSVGCIAATLIIR